MCSHFVSYLWFCSTSGDQIHNGASLYVAYPILSIPCLLMPWWRKSPGHQQEVYWPNKPEYSVSSIRRVNDLVVGLILTHCGLVTQYGLHELEFKITAASPSDQWVNSLGPNDAIWWQKTGSTLAQVITWTNVDLSSVRSSDILLRAISQQVSQPSITVIGLKSTLLTFH